MLRRAILFVVRQHGIQEEGSAGDASYSEDDSGGGPEDAVDGPIAKSQGADMEQLIAEAEHYYGQAYYRRRAFHEEDMQADPDLSHAQPEKAGLCPRAPCAFEA